MDPIKLTLVNGLYLTLGRIGYPDEGMRLTIFDQIPYNFHVELQLSRTDLSKLSQGIKEVLNNPYHKNMP